jgi:methylmalonyl-CoA mutase
MSDDAPGTEILSLSQDFPPVPTSEWEAQIHVDLKGADYEKKLVWRTEEKIAVRPYYRSENLAGLEGQLDALPAQFPFVRGSGKRWELTQKLSPRPDAIRADLLHEAGAHAVQELGYALAAGVERLAKLSAKKPVDAAAGEIDFVFAVGSTYFFEIAKLRAARLLWAKAVAAFEPKDQSSCLMHLAVRTSQRNKSLYDRYTNLLRVTTEALSAVIGGCDQLAVDAFGFDPHLALNVQRIIKEESHLDVVADPAGGSYYIEALTDSLAREAWKLFQQVEAEGGYSAVVASGSMAKALAESRGAREKAVSSRRRVLVGVNNYPNVNEKTPEFAAPAHADSALPQTRMAEPFERIRERTAQHTRDTGRCPKVLLLKRGDVKMRSARANFCLNFFGCAGFDLVESEEYAGQDADLIVLCSSDPEYLLLAQEVYPKVKVPVLVAGNPKDQIEALKAAGVHGFVHVQSDAVETLTAWQDRIGMRAIQ